MKSIYTQWVRRYTPCGILTPVYRVSQQSSPSPLQRSAARFARRRPARSKAHNRPVRAKSYSSGASPEFSRRLLEPRRPRTGDIVQLAAPSPESSRRLLQPRPRYGRKSYGLGREPRVLTPLSCEPRPRVRAISYSSGCEPRVLTPTPRATTPLRAISYSSGVRAPSPHADSSSHDPATGDIVLGPWGASPESSLLPLEPRPRYGRKLKARDCAAPSSQTVCDGHTHQEGALQ